MQTAWQNCTRGTGKHNAACFRLHHGWSESMCTGWLRDVAFVCSCVDGDSSAHLHRVLHLRLRAAAHHHRLHLRQHLSTHHHPRNDRQSERQQVSVGSGATKKIWGGRGSSRNHLKRNYMIVIKHTKRSRDASRFCAIYRVAQKSKPLPNDQKSALNHISL